MFRGRGRTRYRLVSHNLSTLLQPPNLELCARKHWAGPGTSGMAGATSGHHWRAVVEAEVIGEQQLRRTQLANQGAAAEADAIDRSGSSSSCR